MNWGRVAVVAVLGAAVLGGALLYYVQVFGFYRDIGIGAGALSEGLTEIRAGDALVEPSGFEAIARDSSPISFRACFEVTDPEGLRAAATPFAAAVPQIAPFWFDCFDAEAIGADLAAGRAEPLMLQPDYLEGIDRVAALYPDGRVFAWQQINEKLESRRRID